jgi:hypothetical protein
MISYKYLELLLSSNIESMIKFVANSRQISEFDALQMWLAAIRDSTIGAEQEPNVAREQTLRFLKWIKSMEGLLVTKLDIDLAQHHEHLLRSYQLYEVKDAPGDRFEFHLTAQGELYWQNLGIIKRMSPQ